MLEVVSSEKAMEIISECTGSFRRFQSTPLEESFGRNCAEDVFSPEDLPAFERSTVDGYAVKASDLYGCSESIPAMLSYEGEILIGEVAPNPLKKGCCMKIPTGGRLPEGADAVCMVEYSDDIGDEFRYFYKPVSVHENVVQKGEDCRLGSLVLGKGTRIGAKNIAILAALGISTVKTFRPLRVGILSTGDELIGFEEKPEKAQIRDINSVMLAAQVEELGAKPAVYPIVRDQEEALEAAIKKAAKENDLVCISGGSSAGEKDSTLKILAKLGEVKFHGISIKPGKPTMFAMIGETPVFGLPGHPQAAFFIFLLFAAPVIAQKTPRTVSAALAQNIPSNHGREEIIPVKIEGGLAVPVRTKSGVVSVLSSADGYLIIGRNTEGLPKGTKTDIFLF